MPFWTLKDDEEEYELEDDEDEGDGGGGDEGGGGGDEGGGDDFGGGGDSGGGWEGGGGGWSGGGESDEGSNRDWSRDEGGDRDLGSDDDDDPENDGDGFMEREQRRAEQERERRQQEYDNQQRLNEAFREQQRQLEEQEQEVAATVGEQDQRLAVQDPAATFAQQVPAYQPPEALLPKVPEAEVQTPVPGEVRPEIKWDTDDPNAWVAVRDKSNLDKWIPVSEFDPVEHRQVDERIPTLGPPPAGTVAHLTQVGDRVYTRSQQLPASSPTYVSAPPGGSMFPQAAAPQGTTPQVPAPVQTAANAAANATAATGAPPAQVAQAAANAAVETLDRQTFQQQTAWTKMAFQARYGQNAASEWAKEHNAELARNQQVYGSREPQAGTPSRVAGIGVAPNRVIGVTPPPEPGSASRYGVNVPAPKPAAAPAAAAKPAGMLVPADQGERRAPTPAGYNPPPTAPPDYTGPGTGTRPGGGLVPADRGERRAPTPAGYNPPPLPSAATAPPAAPPSSDGSAVGPGGWGDLIPPAPAAAASPPASIYGPSGSSPYDETPPSPSPDTTRADDWLDLEEHPEHRIARGGMAEQPLRTTITRAQWDASTPEQQALWKVRNARMNEARLGVAPTEPAPPPYGGAGNRGYGPSREGAHPPGPNYETAPILPSQRPQGGYTDPTWPRPVEQETDQIDLAAVHDPRIRYSTTRAEWNATPKAQQDEWRVINARGAAPAPAPARAPVGAAAPTTGRPLSQMSEDEISTLINQASPVERGRLMSARVDDSYQYMGDPSSRPASSMLNQQDGGTLADPFDVITSAAARAQGNQDLTGFKANVASGIAAGEAWTENYVNDLARAAWYRESRGLEGDPSMAPRSYIEDWKGSFRLGDLKVPGVREASEALVAQGVAPPASDPFNVVVTRAARAQGVTDLSGFAQNVSAGIAAGEKWAEPYLADVAKAAWYRESGGREGPPSNAPAEYIQAWTSAFRRGEDVPLGRETAEAIGRFTRNPVRMGGAPGATSTAAALTKWINPDTGVPGGKLVPDQFNHPDVKNIPGWQKDAACGITAAIGVSRALGGNPTLADALKLAKDAGWSGGAGMGGTANQVKLMNSLGIPTRGVEAADQRIIDEELAAGRPVVIDTAGGRPGLEAGHYFTLVSKTADGNYVVSGSGTALNLGKEIMSRQSMENIAGGWRNMVRIDPGQIQQAPAQAAPTQGRPLTAPAQAAPSQTAPAGVGTGTGVGSATGRPAAGREQAPQVAETPLPDRLGTGSNRVETLRAWQPALEEAERKSGIPAEQLAAIIIAENGAGQSDLSSAGNNWFSIQRSNQEGSYQNGDYGPDPRWGTYKNPVDSLNHFLTLVSTQDRYRGAWDNRTNPEQFIAGLIKGKYIVDEPGHPAAKWQQEMADYRQQYRKAIGR